jgi:hypothetical protein
VQIVGRFEDDLTVLNVLDRIQFLFPAGDPCDPEIEFCSSHFFELDSTAVSRLPFEIFSSVISKDSIRLKDEESLYEMIVSHQIEDSRFYSLFEHVRFEYLSTKSIQSFIELINQSFDLLTFPIWQSLSHRLSLSVPADFWCDRFCGKYSSVVCPFVTTSNLDGIISYLTKRFGGHVIDRNIVSITASSIGNAQSHPLRYVADFENRSMFHTNSEGNSWICYNFKDMLIILTHYSIRTRRDVNGNHLRSWKLEGSIDGLKWVRIDDRTGDSSLNSAGAISTFSISEGFQSTSRMIRLQQTGMNSSGGTSLVVSAIEFFGVLKEPINQH